MFERPQGGERAVLVQLNLPELTADTALEEFRELALSAGAVIVSTVVGAREKPEPKYFIGLGKAEEVRDAVLAHNAALVLVNHELSPSQARNLERLLQCRVVDRSGLILDIFATRARTFEGKLQVELAQLEHLATRLIRGWTHLERQKGGIGLRGPGETQLETDRRLLRDRIKIIKERLEKVRKTREQNRRSRQKAAIPTVALVGYTNAGKSTLFNALTAADIYVADKLFATLDPTLRRLQLKGASDITLVDTVGFIRDLPHQLIDAFHATLEETLEADLLLQVIDSQDENWRDAFQVVKDVLRDLGADAIPCIHVFNKIDGSGFPHPLVLYQNNVPEVWLSAKNAKGLDLLCNLIAKVLNGDMVEEEITLSANEAKLRAALYDAKAVIEEMPLENGGWQLRYRMSAKTKATLLDS